MAERSRPRAATLAAAAFSVLCLAAPAVVLPAPFLVYNASASAPLGFYRVLPDGSLERGDLVLAWLPDPARWFAAARGYLPATVPLVKRVAALGGDVVCADSGIVVINDRVAAPRRSNPMRSSCSWRAFRLPTTDVISGRSAARRS